VLRVLPNNVNEHRLNQFGGSLLSGKDPVGAQTLGAQNFQQQNHDRYYDQCQHPTMQTRSAIEAQTVHPEYLARDTSTREVCEDFTGPLFGGHAALVAPGPGDLAQRERSGCGPCMPSSAEGNVGGLQGQAPRASEAFVMAETDREACGHGPGIYGGELRGFTQAWADPQRCTLRQTTECDTRVGALGTTIGAAPSTGQQFDMGVPLRETQGRVHHGGMPQAYASVPGAANNTQRGQESVTPTGLRCAVGAPQTPHTFENRSMREHAEYVAGPMRMNHTADPGSQLPNFESTRVSNQYRDPGQGYVFQEDYATPGQVDISTQPVVENYGGPWGFQIPNDPNNPFVHDISSGHTLPRHG
jgi:hypothetical protein